MRYSNKRKHNIVYDDDVMLKLRLDKVVQQSIITLFY